MDCGKTIHISLTIPHTNTLFMITKRDKTFGDIKNFIEEQTGIPRDILLLCIQGSYDIILDWISIKDIICESEATLSVCFMEEWVPLIKDIMESNGNESHANETIISYHASLNMVGNVAAQRSQDSQSFDCESCDRSDVTSTSTINLKENFTSCGVASSISKLVETLPKQLNELLSDEDEGHEVFLALFLCICRNLVEAVKTILENFNKAYFRNKTSADRNIYHAIAISGNENLLAIVSNYCRRYTYELLLQLDENGENPLSLARRMKYSTLADIMKEKLKSTSLETSKRNTGDQSGETAVDIQIENAHLDTHPEKSIDDRLSEIHLSTRVNSFTSIPAHLGFSVLPNSAEESASSELSGRTEKPRGAGIEIIDSYFIPTSPLPLASGSVSMQFPWLTSERSNEQSIDGDVEQNEDQNQTTEESKDCGTTGEMNSTKSNARRVSLQQLVNVEAWRNKRLNSGRTRRITIAGIQESEDYNRLLELQKHQEQQQIDSSNDGELGEKNSGENEDFPELNESMDPEKRARLSKPWNEWQNIKRKYTSKQKQRPHTSVSGKHSSGETFEEWMVRKIQHKSPKGNFKQNHQKALKNSISKEEQARYFEDWLEERKKRDLLKKQEKREILKKTKLLNREKEEKKELAKQTFDNWLARKYEEETKIEESKFLKRKSQHERKLSRQTILPKLSVNK